jgi:hypothetical protein
MHGFIYYVVFIFDFWKKTILSPLTAVTFLKIRVGNLSEKAGGFHSQNCSFHNNQKR